jgi:hypothetical protein
MIYYILLFFFYGKLVQLFSNLNAVNYVYAQPDGIHNHKDVFYDHSNNQGIRNVCGFGN